MNWFKHDGLIDDHADEELVRVFIEIIPRSCERNETYDVHVRTYLLSGSWENPTTFTNRDDAFDFAEARRRELPPLDNNG